MSTILVFLITTLQLIAVAVGYVVPIAPLFDAFAVYGSPMFFIINLLGHSSVAFESNIIFPLIAMFHVIKYLCLARSQFGYERRSLHILSVIFEVIYLVICAMHLP